MQRPKKGTKISGLGAFRNYVRGREIDLNYEEFERVKAPLSVIVMGGAQR